MKPLIGVMPLVDDEKESLWMLPGYMDGITEAGGIPIMLPLTADIDDIKQLQSTGVSGVVIGSALYKDKIDLKEALKYQLP